METLKSVDRLHHKEHLFLIISLSLLFGYYYFYLFYLANRGSDTLWPFTDYKRVCPHGTREFSHED